MNFKIGDNFTDSCGYPFSNKIILEDMISILEREDNLDFYKDTTFLITGAYGMIASYIVYYLIFLNEIFSSINITIIAQGRNEGKMRQRFGDYFDSNYFIFLQQDICESVVIYDDIDYIIHAASLASPQYYGTSPVDVLKPNCIGTYNLLNLAKEKNIKGLLFLSSGEVYGALCPRKDPYTENDFGPMDPMDTRSCYGESKRMGENMCRSFYEQYDVPTKVVRIAHTYGPTLDLEGDQRVMSDFVKCIVEDRNIELKTDGSAERMFCYIVDAVDALIRILIKGTPGDVYNMYNNKELLSIRELANKLVKLFPEKKLKVVFNIGNHQKSYLENPVVKSAVMSTDKLNKLGWQPRYDVEDGFKRTVLSFWQ